jgi:hypothetical protein
MLKGLLILASLSLLQAITFASKENVALNSTQGAEMLLNPATHTWYVVKCNPYHISTHLIIQSTCFSAC